MAHRDNPEVEKWMKWVQQQCRTEFGIYNVADLFATLGIQVYTPSGEHIPLIDKLNKFATIMENMNEETRNKILENFDLQWR